MTFLQKEMRCGFRIDLSLLYATVFSRGKSKDYQFMGLLDNLKKLFRPRVEESFDPSVFGDEIALKTEWTPLVPGGANFKTKKLSIKSGVYKAVFKASLGSMMFGGVFLLIERKSTLVDQQAECSLDSFLLLTKNINECAYIMR